MLFPLVVTFSFVMQVCSAYDVSFARLTDNQATHESRFWSTAIFSNGDVVVGGSTKGLIGFDSAGGSDFLLQRFSTTGSLLWTRVFGGLGHESIEAVAVDSSDNIYATGYAYSAANVVADVFIAKFDAFGNTIYSNQIGGTKVESGNAICVDSLRGVFFVAGYTRSTLFYDVASFSGGEPHHDAFLLKLDSATGTVIHNSQQGVLGYSITFSGLALDSSGAAWATGTVRSPSFHGRAILGGGDIFVQKFSSSGASLVANSLGATLLDQGIDIVCDTSDSAYVTGWAPLSVDGQPNIGSTDILVAKFNSAGTKLWTKLVGSDGHDVPIAITVDSTQGLIYITGKVQTTNFYGVSIPTTSTAYLLVLSSNDGSYVSSMLFPSASGGSVGTTVATNGGMVYMAGYTGGNFQGQTKSGASGTVAAFVLKLNGGSPAMPSADPTLAPVTKSPTSPPSAAPSSESTVNPSSGPTVTPTTNPTLDPTADPTMNPTSNPTVNPTAGPTAVPTADPTTHPSVAPTASPSADPTIIPTVAPTTDPTINPTVLPTAMPTTATPTALPSEDPTVVPTVVPTVAPTASPTRVCLQWALGDYGESCSATCDKLSRTCKDKYLKDVVSQEAFYAVVGSAVNVRSGGAVGSAETFCCQTGELAYLGAPAALSIVLSSEDHHSPVRTSCSYPASAAEATVGCDAVLPLRNYRRFCPCVDHNCDGAWYLGYSGDSCDATCTSAGGVCDAEPLSSIVNADAFSVMVASATVVETNELIGESSAAFCHEGINTLPLAPAPAVITLTFGAVNDTFCVFPTDVSKLQGSCDMAFTNPPAQRFCNCKELIEAAPTERRMLLDAAVTTSEQAVSSQLAPAASPRLRGKAALRVEM